VVEPTGTARALSCAVMKRVISMQTLLEALSSSSLTATKLFLCAPLLIALASIPSGKAAMIQARSPSAADVQAAANVAVSGDTVVVPAGTASWSSTVSISSKNITVQGAGVGQTIINASTTAFDLGRTSSRVTGFTVVRSGSGEIIRCWGRGWRIDHCRFESSIFRDAVLVRGNSDGLSPGEHPQGLIDNCTSLNCRVLVYGDMDFAPNRSVSRLWTTPSTVGGADAVFVEDCGFEFTEFGNAMDSNFAAKYVFRFNTLTNVYVEAHSVQGNHRASRSWEIYGNQFVATTSSSRTWTPMFLRGGTGVIFNNSFIGSWSSPSVTFDVVRGFSAVGPGLADGGCLWDGNIAVSGGTGTHNGATSTSTLTDTTKNWTASAFVNDPIKKWVYNLTTGAKGQITANTANSVTATLGGGNRTDWRAGDQYRITGGYPARDQIGRGQDASLWTDASPYPAQANEPVYIWGNKHGANDVSVAINNGAQVQFLIKKDRDYVLAPKPGYAPYVYPHPFRALDLAGGGGQLSRPSPPQNLRIIP
jgi:hypothetical protein